MTKTSKTAKQAAVEVLKRAGEPLKTTEIAERVLKTQGVQLAGKTPGATIAAILAVESKKPDGLFIRTAPGTYTLRAGKEEA
jgi:HB1, ASXL, restriction endonuclease HTH domain